MGIVWTRDSTSGRLCTHVSTCRIVWELVYRSFPHISDSFLRPAVLHVIMLCSLVAGGRSLAARLPAVFCKKWQHVRGQQHFHPSVLPRHVNQRSSRLLLHNQASLISVRACMGEGGGFNCEVKAEVLVVTPSPLFFLEVGRKKGGHNSRAVRYFLIYIVVGLHCNKPWQSRWS